MNPEDIFKQVMMLYNEEKFSEGYRLITSSQFDTPASLQRAYYFRLCLAARMGDLENAEAILAEALGKGFFYQAQHLVEDPDLVDLQGRSNFKALVQRNGEILNEHQKKARPEIEMLEPEITRAGAAMPLLMALHGNNAGLQQTLPVWGIAARKGWLTALPQSSQVAGEGIYGWTDHALAQEEIKQHYANIVQKYRLDEDRTVIAGFSMGGYAAIEAALKQTFPIRRFIGIGPYFADLGPWQGVIRRAVDYGLRGYLLLGEEDEPITANAVKFQQMLEENAIPCGMEIFPGLGHDYPESFDDVFDRAMKYLFM